MDTVLVTGGSSGIGLELAKLFARDGYRVLIVALDQAEIEEALSSLRAQHPGAECHGHAFDLTETDAAKRVAGWVEGQGWVVDILCNNAGIGLFGDFLEEPPQLREKMIALNVGATVALTDQFLPGMRERNKGRIMMLSSVTSMTAVPPHTTYAATKTFVDSFSRSLYYQEKHRKSKITVTSVIPAAVRDTGFQETQGTDVDTFKTGIATTTPDEVARDAYQATLAGKKRVYTGKRLRFMLRMGMKILPESWVMPLVFKELQDANRR